MVNDTLYEDSQRHLFSLLLSFIYVFSKPVTAHLVLPYDSDGDTSRGPGWTRLYGETSVSNLWICNGIKTNLHHSYRELELIVYNHPNFKSTSFYSTKHVMDPAPEKRPLLDESTTDFANIYDVDKNTAEKIHHLGAQSRFLLRHKAIIIRHVRLWQTRLRLPHLFDDDSYDMSDRRFLDIMDSVISGTILVTISALMFLALFSISHAIQEEEVIWLWVALSCFPAVLSLECWLYLVYGPIESQNQPRAGTLSWLVQLTQDGYLMFSNRSSVYLGGLGF